MFKGFVSQLFFSCTGTSGISSSVGSSVSQAPPFSVSLPGGTYRAYSQSGEFLMLAKVEDGVMSTIKSFFDVQ